MRTIEAFVFVTLAGAAHLAAFGVLAPAGGSVAQLEQGAEGAATVTLASLPANLEVLLESWEQTPVPATPPNDIDAPRNEAEPELSPHRDFSTPDQSVLPDRPTVPAPPDQANLDTRLPGLRQIAPNSALTAPTQTPELPHLLPPDLTSPNLRPMLSALASPRQETAPQAETRLPALRQVAPQAPVAPSAPEAARNSNIRAQPLTQPPLAQTPPAQIMALVAPSVPTPDTRLPALRDVVQPAPDAFAAPAPPARDRAALPTADAPLARPAAPRAAQPQATQALPEIDPASAQSAMAPVSSRRPALRPEGLAPPPRKAAAKPAPKPTAKAKAKPKNKAAAKPKASPAPKPAAKPRPTQKAAGAGGGAQNKTARKAGKPKATGPSTAQVRQQQAAWGAKIRSAIQRQMRASNAKGRVRLRIKVSASGRMLAANVTGSSGNAGLDRIALQAARKARMPRAPKALQASSYSFNLNINSR